MDKNKLAFNKRNFILIAIGVAIIVIGFILMSGTSTTSSQFDPTIFSTRRIEVAPIVTLFGFLFIVYGILYKGKDTK